jgi:cytochrome P450
MTLDDMKARSKSSSREEAAMSSLIDPYDLIAPENYGARGTPHDAWAILREKSPVHRCEFGGDFEDFWAITRHADIIDLSSKPQIFSNREGPMILSRLQKLQVARRAESPMGKMRTIIEMDPPEHRDFRKVASGFFTPRSIRRLDEIVTESARAVMDSLGEEGECDFVEKVAQRHPLRVLATILGIDREDEERVLELTQQLFASEDPDLQRKGEDRDRAQMEIGLEFYQMFDRITQDRRARRRDDLATLLATAKMADGAPMGPIETFGYYLIVFTAGHDTTRNALSAGFAAMLENPDQLELLKKRPELSKQAAEEVVRWASPVNHMKRHVLEDVEIRGQKIRAGDSLALFYASANRDEDVFEDPFRFDITRHPNRHLGFGTGEHFCLGAHLARASIRALLEEMGARIESCELAGEPSQIHASFVVGLKTLPVRYKIKPARR